MTRYSEREIAIEALKLLEEEGDLSMTQIRKTLTKIMKPSGHDLKVLEGRNDTIFDQNVRNIKSHNVDIFMDNVVYENGRYYSRKYYKSKCNNPKTQYDIIISKRKKKTAKFRTQILDFEKINRERKEVGNEGEEFVLRDQKRIVKNNQPDLEKDVKNIAKEKGDGAGYDIHSFDEKGQPLYIEVKTTKGRKQTPFYMSATEYAFYEMHKDRYVIARVYEYDKETKQGKVEYINGNRISKIFTKETSTYKFNYK